MRILGVYFDKNIQTSSGSLIICLKSLRKWVAVGNLGVVIRLLELLANRVAVRSLGTHVFG